jgi:hypothetical protein
MKNIVISLGKGYDYRNIKVWKYRNEPRTGAQIWGGAMTRCNGLIALGRRQFLKGGATAAAATLGGAAIPPDARATPALARVTYPSTKLANVKDLKIARSGPSRHSGRRGVP